MIRRSEEAAKRVGEKLNKLLAGELPSVKLEPIKKIKKKKPPSTVATSSEQATAQTSSMIPKSDKPIKSKIGISDLFDEQELTVTSNGYKLACPSCGLQGNRTQGFIIFPEDDRAYCHSSKNTFSLLEVYALKKGILKCRNGRGKGQKGKILVDGMFKESLDALQEEYAKEFCDKVLEQIGIRPSIELPNNGVLISEFADMIAVKFANEYNMFYRTETKDIVEIRKKQLTDGSFEYEGFDSVKPSRFITKLERYYKPYARIFTKTGGTINVTKSLSQNIAKTILVSDNLIDKMPVINRIFPVQLPILYQNKLTFPKVGYDERFRSWSPHNAPTIVNANMSINAAKEILTSIFNEFCFRDPQDKTNAIAALITPALRGLYDRRTRRTPVIAYMANRPRCGKDYCAGITGILYEGFALEESPISGENKSRNAEEELRKKIMAGFRLNRKRFHFPNNKGNLNNAVFEAVTTMEYFSDRLLGYNDILTFPNEFDFSISGNMGITMTPDFIDRCIFINLFLDMEDANARTFNNPNLHGWVLKNRNAVLSAIYSLIRNWFEKGCPAGTVPFASFHEWARVCGGIMESAGYDSPCIRDKENVGVSQDTETDNMKNLFEICFEQKTDMWIKKADIKEIIIKSPDELFGEVDWNNKADQIKFGVQLNKFVGRILSDIKLIVRDKNARTARWEYKFVKEKATYIPKSSHNHLKSGNDGNVGNQMPCTETSIVYSKKKSRQNIANITIITKSTKNEGNLQTRQNVTKVAKEPDEREIQFDAAEECAAIKSECTREDILNYLKENNQATLKELKQKLGKGVLKIKNQLVSENKIKQEGDILKC